jgi:hypothetical protein
MIQRETPTLAWNPNALSLGVSRRATIEAINDRVELPTQLSPFLQRQVSKDDLHAQVEFCRDSEGSYFSISSAESPSKQEEDRVAS